MKKKIVVFGLLLILPYPFIVLTWWFYLASESDIHWLSSELRHAFFRINLIILLVLAPVYYAMIGATFTRRINIRAQIVIPMLLAANFLGLCIRNGYYEFNDPESDMVFRFVFLVSGTLMFICFVIAYFALGKINTLPKNK
jgi:hypothetical protein